MRTFWRAARGWIAGATSLATGVGLLALGGWAAARDGAADAKTSTDELLAVLRDEAAGKETHRAAALADARAKRPQDETVQWHAGYMRWKDQWVRFDQLADDPTLQSKLGAYEKQRESAEDTPAGHLALADWCRAQSLFPQERIHLQRVLAAAPNHAAVRARLGWRQVGGAWIAQEDLESARRQSEATAKASREALPKIKRALGALSSRNVADRQKAEKTLAQFVDPALVPVYLAAFDGADEDVQTKLVDILSRMDSPLSAVALARIAVENPYGAVGESAAQALRSRPFYDYVPALLGIMSTPVETRFVVAQVARNQLQFTQVFLRETENRKEQLVVGHALRQAAGNVNPAQARQLLAAGEDRVQRVGDVNASVENVNRCVASVLNVATGQDLPPTPDAWWKWWYDLNESYPAEDKPTYTMAAYSYETIPTSPPIRRHECLVAGTPIWTISGMKAVETIKAGDLVLAQDPDSGELAYKAVITPTERPAGPTVRIETEKDVIRASGGHLFWVAGEGWRRARSLQAGQRLHDVQGSTAIRSVTEETEPVLTYNLVVDGFHSYFVGEGKVLSHDNSIPRGTAAKVPGFAAP